MRALACVVEYAAWLKRHDDSLGVLEEIDLDGAKRQVTELLMGHPDGRDLEDGEMRRLLTAYGIDLWERVHVATVEEAIAAGEQMGWDVVLKGTAERLRQRPDQAHVWRNIDDEDEMRDAWESLMGIITHPAGTELDLDSLTALLAAYDIELWQTRYVTGRDEAIAAGEALGWDVVLKATAEHLRERPDQAHVWRNIDDAAEMADAWDTLGTLIAEPERAGFVVQKNARPGVPVAIRSIEDPLFGPVVSFGIAGPLTELLADRSYRIPPLGARDAASMVREIKSSPMLFGYRGSEAVDVAEVERLIQRVSQLQNDVPQVSALELSLVLAGADGATVLTASARVDPVLDPRSDWFVRRLSQPAGDTLPS